MNYLAEVQRRFLADLRIQPGTLSQTIARHKITKPVGFDARGHSAILRGLRAAGVIVAVKVDRSASPSAHHGYVTRWSIVRGAK